MQKDISIYEDVANEFYELISNKEKIEHYDDGNLIKGELYIFNSDEVEELKILASRLEMEYGHDELLFKKYNLSSIVKVLNMDEPSYRYVLYTKETWEQINDQEKVKAQLETKFIKWKNRYRKNIQLELEKKKVVQEKRKEILRDVEREIEVAFGEYEYIRDNFDDLEVRYSNYKHKNKYVAILYYIYNDIDVPITTKREVLKNSVPNVLYFKELEPLEKMTPWERFMIKAKNPFGGIYYAKKGFEHE